MSELKKSLQDRSQKAILQHAIMRWESAAMIGITLISTVLAFLFSGGIVPSWGWIAALLLGSAAEVGIVMSSLRDPDANAEAVKQMLQTDFKPENIKHEKLRSHVKQALDYRARINSAIDRRSDSSALSTQLAQTAVEMDDWIENVYSLASRIDRYLQERQTLKRDYQNAKRRLDQLQKKRIKETDSIVLDQIDRNMESLTRQVETIDKLGSTMDRAHLQLENTLSALGTIYSQTMLAGAKDIDNARAKRLQHEVHEEIVSMNDVLEVMDEVYAVDY